MFCYQCEQSQKGNCHSSIGVCGKDETTAAYQDLLLFATRGVSVYAHLLRELGVKNNTADRFVLEALFTTITNVNFDPDTIIPMIKKAYELKLKAKSEYLELCVKKGVQPAQTNGSTSFEYPANDDKLFTIWDEINIESRFEKYGKAITGLEELCLYGLKGLAAYAYHALMLGYENDEIYSRLHESMAFLDKEHTAEELLGKALDVGDLNLLVMKVLDEAHTTTYGHPVPTPVNINPVEGKAILVSGHDMKDLELLLKQTEGKGINIYTHGEMLPAHGYPELKKYSHLVGNYGGAWQDQHREFDAFPGSILMTTNCIQKPRRSYKDRIFTCGMVQWPDVTHIDDHDFSAVIESALAQEGFTKTEEPKTILTGFGHNAVLGVADKIVEAVQSGDIKHFYLIGGCDGAKPGRNYFTDYAMNVPKDSVVLTLACGKFRFNKQEFGDIGGIPRLLDVGQCNDAYSAIQIALALANAFDTDVNSLPLSFIISWYEQKAVSVLLTLLHLGVKNIKLGPTLPQFIEPEVLQILVDNFQIAPTGKYEEDLAATL